MLRNIRDTKVVMDEELAITAQVGRLTVTYNHLHEGGLAGTISTQNSNSGTERHLDVNVVERIEIISRVPVIHAFHLQKLLRRRLDALESSRFGERELEIGSRQLEVMLRLRKFLDEVRHLAAVVHEFSMRPPRGAILVVDDIGTDILDKRNVVRYDEDRSAGKLLHVLGKPADGVVIKMISRLIEEENIGINENSSGKTKLHLPTTRQLPNRPVNHFVRELELVQHGLAVGLRSAGGSKQMLEDVLGLMDGIDVGTGIDVLGLEMRWPSLELAIVDGIHQCGLSHTILAQ
mmetsp:Transcript_2571/g.7553  ORF Transcript_2571/g.7553 Transcript_2571/m.7553 type:complete len:291 (-) Transcript_2571:508-1380(-)